MTTTTSPPLLTPLARCWACDADALDPAHRERFVMGAALTDPEVADVLRPYDGTTFRLTRCRRCGFLQPEGVPTHPDYFDALYNQKWSAEWAAAEFDSPYKDYIFQTVLARLARLVPAADRRLLDVGTHVGRMVHLADRAGWTAEGIELNPRTAAYAAERTGRPVHRLNAAALADTGARYGAVVLTDVLEHIPNPGRVLADLRRLLAPGGWVAVKVPHGPNQRLKQVVRSWFDRTTETGIALNLVHVNHFTPTALRRALERAGFDRIEVTVGAPELYPPAGLKSRLGRAGRMLTYHAARLLPGGSRTPLALNLQAYARNPA